MSVHDVYFKLRLKVYSIFDIATIAINSIIIIILILYSRPYSWIKEKKMGSFLSVAQGSDEDPWFLEIKYNGATSPDTNPLVLVGKGK